MADGFIYPGVHVQEDRSATPSSAQRPTSVPAFLCFWDVFESLFIAPTTRRATYERRCKQIGSWTVKVNNWLDFEADLEESKRTNLTVYLNQLHKSGTPFSRADAQQRFAEAMRRENQLSPPNTPPASDGPNALDSPNASAANDPDSANAQEESDQLLSVFYQRIYYSLHLVQSLKAYFDNGGGPCYVVRASDDGDFEHVTALEYVTLLVQAGLVAEMAQDRPKKRSTAEEEVTHREAWSKTIVLMERVCNTETGIFALMDAHIDGDEKKHAAHDVAIVKKLPATTYGAAYGPWLETPKHAEGWVADVPPSAVMAGIYCKVERERGVWKAPANIQVAGGLRVTHAISEEATGRFNVGMGTASNQSAQQKSSPINIIRCLHDARPTVWGARTLATDNDDFRYVSVRRLFEAVKRDVIGALSFTAYEPNWPPTWERARAVIDHYLYALWEKGALLGDKPEDAYRVAVGLGATMNIGDVEKGLMKVSIGLAAAKPAEFIVLYFGQKTQHVLAASAVPAPAE